LMSKSELIQKIAEQHSNSMARKDVKGVIESLAESGPVGGCVRPGSGWR
jgi:nucleoid DNA-binding protein